MCKSGREKKNKKTFSKHLIMARNVTLYAWECRNVALVLCTFLLSGLNFLYFIWKISIIPEFIYFLKILQFLPSAIL